MIRSFVGAFLWLLVLWTIGAWLEAFLGIPRQVGLLAGLIVAGLFVGYGLRMLFSGRTRARAAEVVTAN